MQVECHSWPIAGDLIQAAANLAWHREYVYGLQLSEAVL